MRGKTDKHRTMETLLRASVRRPNDAGLHAAMTDLFLELLQREVKIIDSVQHSTRYTLISVYWTPHRRGFRLSFLASNRYSRSLRMVRIVDPNSASAPIKIARLWKLIPKLMKV